jgi:HPt (histidine-containing phosphotransfer) domain-containing protein
MGSIRYRPRKNSSQVVSEEAFDELRDAFYERLQAEHAPLMTLAAALAPADQTTSWTYEELVLRAHRLRGRAALFEISAMAEAANTLEQAAARASMSPTALNDFPVRTAPAKLVRLVATVSATGPDDCGAGAG